MTIVRIEPVDKEQNVEPNALVELWVGDKLIARGVVDHIDETGVVIYHPDLMIEIQSPGQLIGLSICMGCGSMKTIST